MRVMYICGMYVPSHGGAEISMYSLLRRLQEKFEWEILAITDERYEKTKDLEEFNKVRYIQHLMIIGKKKLKK